MQESSQKSVIAAIAQQDILQEVCHVSVVVDFYLLHTSHYYFVNCVNWIELVTYWCVYRHQ